MKPAPARSNMATVGVLLMTFGTAETLDDVPAYLSSVRGGRPVPEDLVAEMRRRFALVGGSPLTRITREQAAALEDALDGSGPDSEANVYYRVAVGMRHAPPFIADGLAELARAGAERVIGLVMSPQFSPIIMGGYLRALEAAKSSHPEIEVTTVGAWHDEPAFVDALAERTREALARLDPAEQPTVQVFFTAHSLPRSVADGEPGYIEQLHETAQLVAQKLGLAPDQWRWAYQSAGHTPEPWLTPDVKDLLPELAAQGHRRVLVVPVQFLADHLEVLYDIDVAAREEAASAGVALDRVESLNTMPVFIEALANVVRREARAGMSSAASALS
jgi:protoporphyrin/coproporphyrin ferrochelatase